MASDKALEKIWNDMELGKHDFNLSPVVISAKEIKKSCQEFTETHDKEVRILCKQDRREDRPQVFKDNGVFLLPKKNGYYYIIKGEGYVDVPDINTPIVNYHKQLDFELESSRVGDSEMQHLDYAYANSLIRTFISDPSLVLTIRGRKYTPQFEFTVNGFKIKAESVQTEVDAGYEGRNQIVLIEAKNSSNTTEIIRQLYYPFRQWSENTNKDVVPVFFEKRTIGGDELYYIWQYKFTDMNDYNSIELVRSARYRIVK